MIINIPISLGELIDKISILEIKKDKINDSEKLKFINKELQNLKEVLTKKEISDEINKQINEIKIVNSKLWDIEDQLRKYEKKKIFNDKFIDLARSVYRYNDMRAKIKKKINQDFNSEIIEIKSYQEY